MRCISRSAILLKVGLVNFIFFQLRNEGMQILSQYRWELRVSEKIMGPAMRLRDIPTQTPCSGDSWHAWGLCAHQTREF
jgi:hypothetical protein